MKWSIIVLWASPVMSDMCQDLCVRDLGRSGCPKGSWCKNGNDCQSLFWTTADRTNVCVYIGSSGTCLNRYPVLCHEATDRLGGASGSATAAPTTTPARATTTTTTTVTTTDPIPTTTVTTTHMIQSTRTTATASSIESTTTTTRSTIQHYIQAVTASGSRGHQNEDRPLTLHYSALMLDDRPRVKINFLGNGRNIGFSLMLDTGSERTHIVRANGPEDIGANGLLGYSQQDGIDSSLEPVNRPARWREGYLDVGLAPETGGRHTLYYGSDMHLKSVSVIRTIREVGQLYSEATKFVFEVEIDLTDKMQNGFTGIGLLGAGPTSHFARTAGVFAFMGPPVDYNGSKKASAGSLHIIGQDGGEHLNGVCRSGANIEFFTLEGHDNSKHWVVRGAMESGAIRHEVSYIVDTGAAGVYVTSDILMAVKAALVESGAILEPRPPGHKLRYKNCARYQSLPTIEYTVGTGSSAVTVSITPDDYLFRKFLPEGTCVLELSEEKAGTSRILSISILSKLLTVFDQTRNRIGFCHIRS